MELYTHEPLHPHHCIPEEGQDMFRGLDEEHEERLHKP
jgi:hypothetical protein